MKIPNAKKMPSGNWHCRLRVNGQDISITRPTKKEAIAEAMAIKAGIKEAAKQPEAKRKKTVAQAMDDYIAERQNVLSPSTIRGYRIIYRNRFKSVKDCYIADISAAKWQQLVNAEAKICSAKTLKNAWGFLSSVITAETGQTVKVRLPQVVPNDLPFLTAEEIPIFVKAVHGTDVEIPALLALCSLRRSELLALQWENIKLDENLIQVAGAMVEDEENILVYKRQTKNKTSRRYVPIFIPELRAALQAVPKKEGRVVKVAPTCAWRHINRICAENNLPQVGLHGLRRSFASLAYHLGLSEEATMRIGGWSDMYTMRKIYTKVSEKDIAESAGLLIRYFSENSDQIGNGNGKKADSSD